MSEEKGKEKVILSPQELAELMTETVKKTIASAQGKENESTLAGQPFKKTVGEKDAEKYGSLVLRPKSKTDAKKPLKAFKTGTFLDELFLDEKDQPLGGIPIVCQLGLVGLSGTGKSILIQEIALRSANDGKKVVLVVSEDVWSSPSSRNDLQSRMKQKADIMGLDWETIRNNLFVLDSIKSSQLRNWETLVETYRYLVETLQGIDLLILDSVTLLETYRGALKWRVMELSRYNQVNGVTAIYVCQRAEEKPDTYSVSGGQGVVHNLDALLTVDFKKAVSQLKEDLNRTRPKDKQLKQWAEVHFIHLMTCRLSGFDRTYKEAFISSDGFLKLAQQSQEP